ncbi:MAG: hypothetical protein V3U88_06205 [Methylococcales bacterium]
MIFFIGLLIFADSATLKERAWNNFENGRFLLISCGAQTVAIAHYVLGCTP